MLFELFRKSSITSTLAVVILTGIIMVQQVPALAQVQLVFPRQDINVFMTQTARLDALKRGVQVMKSRPASNPTSWAFQANVHGTVLSNPNWNKCQHRHWWFLAWHRAYLYYLERMLQKAANEPRLRIPYWNYSATNSRSLPTPFRDPSSSLFVSGRNLVSATDQVTSSSVNITRAMSRTAFIGSDAQLGFGGGRESVPVQFPFTNKAGSLEVLPHNAIHVQVGGLMNNPSTSAQDPIFFLHHSNIDRLWVDWLASGGGRANPTDSAFLNATFSLFNENGVLVTHRVRDFIGSTTTLGYYYDDLPPTAQAAIASAVTPAQQAVNDGEAGTRNMVFATIGQVSTTQPTPILAQPVSFPVTFNSPIPTAQILASSKISPTQKPYRFYLALEDINFEKPPTNIYQIYLNQLDATINTSTDIPNFIGILSFFEPYPMNHDHQHGTRNSIFDITENVESLMRAGQFDPSKVVVTVVPIGIMKEGKPTLPGQPMPLMLKTVKIVAGKARPNNKPPGK